MSYEKNYFRAPLKRRYPIIQRLILEQKYIILNFLTIFLFEGNKFFFTTDQFWLDNQYQTRKVE